MKRVVVTGMSGITSLGSDWETIAGNFAANRSGIRRMDEWDRFTELNTRLAGPIDDFKVPSHWTRKQLRSMGRVSRLAVGAAEQALADAGLLGDPSIKDGRMGVACGSSTGSTDEIKAFGNMLLNSVAEGLNANSYVRMMPHTTAANISIFFGLTGRQRLHQRQPGHRLRLRGDQVRAPAIDARRRRRRTVPDRSHGLRRALRHQPEKRRPTHQPAPVRQGPRRPGNR
jgi:3-oxoacyl-(acyl-carrier-protein) synthase